MWSGYGEECCLQETFNEDDKWRHRGTEVYPVDGGQAKDGSSDDRDGETE